MKINKSKLQSLINFYSKQYNISHQFIYYRFFFDSFIYRLSYSKYKDKFILKGGLYLSTLIGLDNRSTIDIDFSLHKINVDYIKEIIQSICELPVNDGIILEVINIKDIIKSQEYGGVRVKICGKFENIKTVFYIDIAIGDPIYPFEVCYRYKTLITDEVLKIKSYSLETYISEKFQTILFRGINNSRNKDLYDLYILRILYGKDIDKRILKEAFIRTCKFRKFQMSKDNIETLIKNLTNSKIFRERWNIYKQQNNYTQNITYLEIINSLIFWNNKILL